MWDSYRRDLRKAVRTSPGREKGLLVANYEVELEIYGSSSLTLSTLREGVKDISLPNDVRQFNKTLEAQDGFRLTFLTSRHGICRCVNASHF